MCGPAGCQEANTRFDQLVDVSQKTARIDFRREAELPLTDGIKEHGLLGRPAAIDRRGRHTCLFGNFSDREALIALFRQDRGNR